MPPKPTHKKLLTKTSSNSLTEPSQSQIPSKSEIKSVLKLENPPKPDLSESNKLKIANLGRETFDLNEPWCVTSEDANEVQEGTSEIREEIEIGNESKLSEFEVKERGLKIEEVPIKEKKKQKEFEVFVGGLDRDAVEEDLLNVFKKVGEVMEVRLVKNKYSQKNKGFAFVRFATIEQAKRAASELNYTQVRGKVCEVTRNNDNETLHLGNICTTWTKDALVEKLKPYELENLEDVHLIEDPNDRRKNRGYAFLNFSTHMDAVAACNKLQKGSLYFGTTVRADVAFAKSAVEPDEEIMAQVKSVFLDGLPESWDEVEVQQQFKKYGEIENVQLARNMPSAKRKDFGFISFSTRDAALGCIDAINKDGVGEGAQKVLVRATLRKPLQKRIPSAVGGWRGYSSNDYDGWGARSSGIGRSYTDRQSRTIESFGRGWGRGRGRGRDRRFSGYSQYAARGGVFRTELSSVEKNSDYNRYSTRRAVFETELSPEHNYGSQFRRGSVRQVPTTAHSRSRVPYFESSSSNRRSSRSYEDFPTSYSHVSSHGRYEDDDDDGDDGYDPQFDYYENSSADVYDYPTTSRLKRPYSMVDEDLLVSRSLTRRSRSGELALDVDAYPVHSVSSYEEYSRSMPDDRYIYDTADYESRYSSGRGAPRSYRY